MLCPALPEVQEYIREMTLRFIHEWGFDGHKLDNIYTVPACHNPAHHHIRPEESTENMAEVYRIIFETTRKLASKFSRPDLPLRNAAHTPPDSIHRSNCHRRPNIQRANPSAHQIL